MRLSFAVLAGVLAVLFGTALRAQTVTPTPETGVTPNVLLLHRADLFPGKDVEYAQREREISQNYDRFKIPVYWLTMSSFTGSPHVLYFDGFDSFEDIEKTGGLLNEALAAHSDLVALQQDLSALANNSSTLLAFRRDDLGYRMNKVDLAKSHYVRVTIVQLRTGTDAEFGAAVRTVRQFFESNDVNAPWVIYQVDSGMLLPAYIQFQPVQSLREMDDALDRRKSDHPPFHDALRQRLIQALQSSLVTAEVQIYTVSGSMSHLPPQQSSSIQPSREEKSRFRREASPFRVSNHPSRESNVGN